MQNRKFDIAYIRRYVQGDLSPKEMHELERAAEADEMLMDLILGVEIEYAKKLPLPTIDLQQRIETRAYPKSDRKILPWKFLGAAASLLAVIGVSAYFLLWSPPSQHEQKIATAERDHSSDQKQEHLPLADTNSLGATQEQRDNSSEQQIAATTAKPAPPIVEEKPRPTREETELPADLLLDSNAIVLAQAPSKQLAAVEVNAAQAHRKQSVAGSRPQILIRGSSSLTSSKADQTVVFGKVLDSETNTPLADIVIKDLISNKTTKADSLGRFVMVSDSNQVNLALSYVGYEPKQLLAGTSELEIRLDPMQNSLEEVVVSGYSKKPSMPKKPTPIGGWRAFEAYIKKAAKASGLTSGSVTLRFDLDAAGNPTHIRIEKSTSAAHEAKAIQVLKDGPKWEHGRLDKATKRTIEFRE